MPCIFADVGKNRHNGVMSAYSVTLASGRKIVVPDETEQAILKSAAKYSVPLWDYRIEKVLKLSQNQWIFPDSVLKARERLAINEYGISCLAWKLFNRGYEQHAELYANHPQTYPDHPRHFGYQVVPLVDEDAAEQHIGWVRIDGCTNADRNHAVFIEFTLLDLFAPVPLPAVYEK